jgi:hypothetical protein
LNILLKEAGMNLNENEEWRHAALKCIEELNELATVLIQQYNKPWKDRRISIQSEIADVKYRVSQLETYYDCRDIESRIQEKWGDDKDAV